MGTLVVTEFMTLDGVAQSPGGPDEDRDGGFEYGGWQAPVVPEDSGGVVFEHAAKMDALVIGRRTYQNFAEYWPKAPQQVPFARLLNDVPKFVASRTLSGPLTWHGSTLIEGDLSEGITALTERYEEVHVIGSLDLVQSLLRLGLVDRLDLWIYPLLLGRGKRLFADGTLPALLRLTESVVYPNGTLHLAYETAGVPTYRDLVPDE